MFTVINGIFLILLSLLCLAPMVHVLAVSLSDNAQVAVGNVLFWPVRFTGSTYRYLLHQQTLWRSLWISLERIAVSLSFTLILTVLSAYPLSKSSDRFFGRTLFAWYFFITMILHGGLIPTYMVVSSLGLIGSFWALVLPNSVVGFYVLVMLNFFRGLPKEIEEAALIDGANQWSVLFRIVLPISTPALATIAVFCSLAQWNEWFSGIIYMKTPRQYPLMSYLQAFPLETETGQAAHLMVAALPILCVYPFLQKYFVRGLVLGS
jgi:putative aldouronate transport system permease protein